MLIGISGALLILAVVGFLRISGAFWTAWDYQALDLFYKEAVKRGYGPKSSSRVVYLAITNDTYRAFGKNSLDRAYLVKVNETLSELGPEGIAYDIIFARPDNPESDRLFEESIEALGNVYLPVAFPLVDEPGKFKWDGSYAHERLQSLIGKKPVEKGRANPFHASRASLALLQADGFSKAAFNTGHISAPSDTDGIYRHFPMIIKLDKGYLPGLSLSMFLDYAQVSFDQVEIQWGKEIRIPATKESFLDEDVVIPIDSRGRVYIPFSHFWENEFPQGNDFMKMTAHTLLKYFDDEGLRGNLAEFYEGNFVYIADLSHGASDIGQNPLENMVPLVSIHGALMNSLLTNTFYREWSFSEMAMLIAVLGVILCLSSAFKGYRILYAMGFLVLLGLGALTWHQVLNFSLLPVVSVAGGSVFIFSGLVTGLNLMVSKERTFIHKAFSKYLSPVLVKGLVERPDLLKSGGEERFMTVFFADLAGFTPISEKLSPHDLAKLMNEYFTNVTAIVLEENGIVNQYAGDEIMVSFGAPLETKDHADRAVTTGLRIQTLMNKSEEKWKKKGLPKLSCRIGINTGTMFFGNLGSKQVYYYSVMGDNVNLASRLEGANKFYGTLLMISEYTLEQITPGRFLTRIVDVVKVKGKSRAVKIYEVYGEKSRPAAADDLLYRQKYQESFEAYLSRNFIQARRMFESVLRIRPNDLAAKNIIARIDGLNLEKITPDWDGSTTLSSK